MTDRMERALIRFLLMWFRCWHGCGPRWLSHAPLPQEYYDLENEVR